MEAQQFGVEGACQRLGGGFGQFRRSELRSGAIDDDVQAAAPGVGLGDSVADRLGVGDVGAEGEHIVGPRRGKRGRGGLERILIAGDERHPHTLFLQGLGDGVADAAAGTRDEGDAVLKSQCHCDVLLSTFVRLRRDPDGREAHEPNAIRTLCRQPSAVLRSPMSACGSECHVHRREKINIACVLKQEICERLLGSGFCRANMRADAGKTMSVSVGRPSRWGRPPVGSDLVSLRSHLFWTAAIPDRIAVGEERRPMAAQRDARTARNRTPRGGVDGVDDAQRLRVVVARLEEETMLWQEFLRAHRTIIDQMAEQMMRDHNLPLEWFDVLIHLADVPDGRLRQRALRDRLLLSESGVSRLLLRMEQAGFIARNTAGEDKRGMEITLTDKGRTAVIEATESHVEMVSTLFTQRLTRTDLNALGRVLPKLTAESEDFATPLNGA